MDSAKRNKLVKLLFIIGIALALIGLAATGRLNWLIALIGAIIPLIPRVISWCMRFLPTTLAMLKNIRAMRAGKSVQVATLFLQASIDRTTGDIQGKIIKGDLQGKELSSLNIDELLGLLKTCQHEDGRSAELLIAFLDQKHSGWRGNGEHQKSGFSSGAMSAEEAREILAVKENASQEDIVKAHKRLIQKIHPDRGGSVYLAAKINQARDTLIT